MTREEAIRIATGLRTDFKCESDTMVDFCNTVIKALEQEPILDKIIAEIVELKNAPPCFDDMFEYKYAVDDVLAIIDKSIAESEG